MITSCRYTSIVLPALFVAIAPLPDLHAIDTIAEAPLATAQPPTKGIPYFLPEAVYIVTTAPRLDEEKKVTGLDVTVAQRLIPDRRQRFTLRPERGVFSAAQSKIGLSDGLLSTINATEVGQLGTVLETIASFAFNLKIIPALETKLTIAQDSSKAFDATTFSKTLSKTIPLSMKGTSEKTLKIETNLEGVIQTITPEADDDTGPKGLNPANREKSTVQANPNQTGLIFNGFRSPEELLAALDRPAFQRQVELAGRGWAQFPLPVDPTQPNPAFDAWLQERNPDLKTKMDTAGGVSTEEILEELDKLRKKKVALSTTDLFADVNPELLKTSRVFRANEFADLELQSAIKLEISLETLLDDGPEDLSSIFPSGTNEPDIFKMRSRPQHTFKVVRDADVLANTVLAKTERARRLQVSLKPTDAKVVASIKQRSESDVKAVEKIMTGIDHFGTSTDWTKAIAAKVKAAETELTTLEEKRRKLTTDLAAWALSNDVLSDGTATFRTAAMAEYLKRFDQEIAEALSNAKRSVETVSKLKTANLTNLKEQLIRLFLLQDESIEASPINVPALTTQSQIFMAPSEEAYAVPFEGLIVGKTTNSMVLVNGVLKDFSSDRPAPIAEVINIPAKIASGYVALLKDLITINVETRQLESDQLALDVTDATALAGLAKLAEPTSAETAQMTQLIKDLTAQKQLLELQKSVTTLSQPPVPATLAALAHAQEVTELTRQKEILELRKAIEELSTQFPTPDST